MFGGLKTELLASHMRYVFEKRKKNLKASEDSDSDEEIYETGAARAGKLLDIAFHNLLLKFLSADGITCCRYNAIGVDCPLDNCNF